MVVLNKIYTRTGDTGETSLSDMSRAPKHATRVNAYGTVDELNATLGIARLHAEGATDDALARIQNDLFDLGADLSRPNLDKDDEAGYPVLRTVSEQVQRLETEIDAMTSVLEPLRSFILPAGTPLAAQLHLSRTVARRAERLAVELSAEENGDANPAAIRYLNRLSDWLFCAARMANNDGKDDVLWVPGANR
ncbi:cob(I)yrinic acid a,c-diamide adenosyltransferase [Celeribacter litoreus]|uniref:cob(I)yrinic acid a,c-diamide adenosyltransferase n=1 Tax=Celeribacter litoreus TaxID=2876714 RepID=UPI001CC92FB1|nr:cob(I)yrinic acid a,c-diamide adenosyltransferase [Celeribacter litoreus]MCA0042386.1 cob(I)yrinic acid a,c-diamide adenosyltransferase [Celeribacter litoreus]